MNDCLSLCNLLKAAAACCERQLNDALADGNVSHCQASILLQIAKKPVSMTTMSKTLCCHKSNITQVVSGLAKKGYIERVTLPTDRRVCQLKMTPKGRQAYQRLEGVLCGRASECMKVFTAAEKRTFATLLKKYVDEHRD